MAKKTKKTRFCRICGQPEKKYAFGYSNLTPFSEICTKCLNRHVRDMNGTRLIRKPKV